MSSPATITRMPLLASSLQTSVSPSSKNWASSMPTTSISEVKSRMLAEESTGVDGMELLSCDTTFSSEYRTSMEGLNISTRCRAKVARLRRRISSSVFPENIEPQITSIRPFRQVSALWPSEKTTISSLFFVLIFVLRLHLCLQRYDFQKDLEVKFRKIYNIC